MQFIECPKCHSKILLVPDLNAMTKAVTYHQKVCKGTELDLIAQIMETTTQ
jgi:phage FluMu protein Com